MVRYCQLVIGYFRCGGAVNRAGHRPVRIRLWTTLTCTEGTADELVSLYEAMGTGTLFSGIEMAFERQRFASQPNSGDCVAGVCAMIIGSSLIARERAKLKPGEQLQHRVSFISTWETLEPLWLTLLLGANILTEAQKQSCVIGFIFGRPTPDAKETKSLLPSIHTPTRPTLAQNQRSKKISRPNPSLHRLHPFPIVK